MNQPAHPIDADAFLTSLRDRSAQGVSTIALDGGELSVAVKLREFSTLVFTFAGAVDRTQYTLPRFAATSLDDYVPASIIALSDPTLARSDDLTLAWYAGHEGFELQKILPDLFRQMIDSLGATRVAFVGSSGGGFAALYYSWHTPGSIAVVSNPQTNLNNYFRPHQRTYRAACWPGLGKDAPFDTVIDANLGPLYADGCANTVIYLQVDSDFYHLRRHFGPFVAALPGDLDARLIVRMANWGTRGHHPVPAAIWIPWINAALAAPETTATSIEETWGEQNPYLLPPLKPIFDTAGGDGLIAASVDEIWANERPFRPPSLKPLMRPPSRDEEIAADLARTATTALLGGPMSERSLI